MMRSSMSRYVALILMLLLGFAGCAATPPGNQGTETTPKQLQARQIIVTLEDATREQLAATAQAISADYHLWQTGSFPLDSIRVQCVVYQVPDDRDIESLLARLKRDPRVESAQINVVFSGIQGKLGDPYGAMAYGAHAVRADRAHRVSTGKGVRITIIDTGLTVDHPDLRGRIFKTANFVEGGEASFPQDVHGTAIAGVIGARADNGIGIFGVAPDAEMQAAKACWYSNANARMALCSSWTLAKAIDFAITSKAQIINMSLSGPADALLERLIRAAVISKIVIVAAAGQDGASPGFPAAMSPVIGVIASDVKGRAHIPTWAADKFILAAPGIDVITTVPKDGYDFLSGSSLAAAHVTGIIALMLERSPGLSQHDIESLLTSTAHLIDANGSQAKIGIADACAALEKLGVDFQC